MPMQYFWLTPAFSAVVYLAGLAPGLVLASAIRRCQLRVRWFDYLLLLASAVVVAYVRPWFLFLLHLNPSDHGWWAIGVPVLIVPVVLGFIAGTIYFLLRSSGSK